MFYVNRIVLYCTCTTCTCTNINAFLNLFLFFKYLKIVFTFLYFHATGGFVHPAEFASSGQYFVLCTMYALSVYVHRIACLNVVVYTKGLIARPADIARIYILLKNYFPHPFSYNGANKWFDGKNSDLYLPNNIQKWEKLRIFN